MHIVAAKRLNIFATSYLSNQEIMKYKKKHLFYFICSQHESYEMEAISFTSFSPRLLGSRRVKPGVYIFLENNFSNPPLLPRCFLQFAFKQNFYNLEV